MVMINGVVQENKDGTNIFLSTKRERAREKERVGVLSVPRGRRDEREDAILLSPEKMEYKFLTIRFLVTRSGARTAELLGFVSPGVSDQEGSVVRDENVLDLLLGGLVYVFLVISYQRF